MDLAGEMAGAARNAALMPSGGPLFQLGLEGLDNLIRKDEIGLLSIEIGRRGDAQIVPFGLRRLHVALPVREQGETIDLAIFSPERPTKYRTLRGLGELLGEGPFREAAIAVEQRDGRASLEVHSDPLAWLQAGRSGICVLNANGAAHLRDLGDKLKLEVPSERYRRRLEEAWRPPPVPKPRIVVSNISPQATKNASGGCDEGRSAV